MNKFIRWYNQNRKMIWITIGIIALIIVVIQLFNYWSKVDNEKTLQQANQTQNMNNPTGKGWNLRFQRSVRPCGREPEGLGTPPSLPDPAPPWYNKGKMPTRKRRYLP